MFFAIVGTPFLARQMAKMGLFNLMRADVTKQVCLYSQIL